MKMMESSDDAWQDCHVQYGNCSGDGENYPEEFINNGYFIFKMNDWINNMA